MNANVTIRPAARADLEAIARIHVDGCREAYAGVLPGSYLEQMSVNEDQTMFEEWLFREQPAPISLVAVTAGQVVGFCVAGPNSGEEVPAYDAEIHKLFVSRACQGQGIGRLLLHAAASTLQRSGYRTVDLWAYTDGQSSAVYQHLGGTVIYQDFQQVDGEDVAVQVFGWSIEDLLRRTAS